MPSKRAQKIHINPTRAGEEPIIANLMQMYLHDLSAYELEDVGRDGRFGYEFLPLYWIEPERHPFLIRVGDSIAGFALVRELAVQVYSMSEFFVMRTYRGSNVGATVATDLFNRFRGIWQVAQEAENKKAQIFWRRVIAEYANGNFTEEWSAKEPKGPKQTFDSRPGTDH